jgi:predicted RNA methylase
MGRVVLLAARRPFRAVIGVEISPALVEIARENLGSARDPRRIVRDVKIVRADASAYALPRGDLVVYMYNPFRGPVLDAVLARLQAAAGRAEVAVLYHTAVEQAALDAVPAFERVADLGFGLVYRLGNSRAPS